MTGRQTGRAVIIAGVARGIGESSCYADAEEGSTVAIAGFDFTRAEASQAWQSL